jgi:CelD/BcsL family acetyltransferase involved in cellulose biosynthesis
MSLASASARSPSPCRTSQGPILGPARPFKQVEVCETLEDARLPWTSLAQETPASPYQSFAFARVWFATIGAAQGMTPLIVVARDDVGQPVALLPFARAARGPLRFAVFLGGKDSNFNLGLFRSGGAWSRDDVAALLSAAAAQATPRLDAFLLMNQPPNWRGIANPLAEGETQPSPSFAYASALPGDFSLWLDARASKDAKKKMRKKRARLEATAALVHSRAAGAPEIDRALAAFHVERRARTEALGVPDPYASTAAHAFLAQLARDGALELHTLSHGDRIIAVFGALPGAERLSGLFIGHDGDPEIARSSPGEIMVHAVVADAIARGFVAFDLGVGEARYKDEACEIVEPLFDSAFAFTFKGRFAAWAFLAARRVKRSVKRSARLKALHARSRRLVGRAGD